MMKKEMRSANKNNKKRKEGRKMNEDISRNGAKKEEEKLR